MTESMRSAQEFSGMLRWLDRATLFCVDVQFGYPHLSRCASEVIEAAAKPDATPLDTIKQTNKAALLLWRAGAIVEANDLLSAAIELCGCNFEETGASHWSHLAVSPKINQIRLASYCQDALSVTKQCFELYRALEDDELGALLFPSAACRTNRRGQRMPDEEHNTSLNACILESLRCCLIQENMELLDRIVSEWTRHASRKAGLIDRLFLEAKGRIEFSRSDYDGCLKTTNLLWNDVKRDEIPNPLVLNQALLVFSAVGAKSRGAQLVEKLVTYANQLLDAGLRAQAMRIYYRLAICSCLNDEGPGALRYALAANHICGELEDYVIGRRTALLIELLSHAFSGSQAIPCECKGTNYLIDQLLGVYVERLISGGHSIPVRSCEALSAHPHLGIDITRVIPAAGGCELPSLPRLLQQAYEAALSQIEKLRVGSMAEALL
jgi:hypothetical protein